MAAARARDWRTHSGSDFGFAAMPMAAVARSDARMAERGAGLFFGADKPVSPTHTHRNIILQRNIILHADVPCYQGGKRVKTGHGKLDDVCLLSPVRWG